MARMLRNLVNSVLFVLLIALLALTFVVAQRNSFDMGDIASDLPLLAAIWVAFAILVVAGMGLSGRWERKREQHT